jgi:hypothetical protein
MKGRLRRLFSNSAPREDKATAMAQPTMNALVKLITDSVAKVDKFCGANNIKLPSLDEPFTLESEAPRMQPEVSEAVSNIISAAAQLIAVVRPAPITVMTTAIQVRVVLAQLCVLVLLKNS